MTLTTERPHMDHDPSGLLSMSEDEFTEVVNRELRDDLSEAEVRFLKAPVVLHRWYAHLVVMKKTVETTLSAKNNEHKAEMISIRDRASVERRAGNEDAARALEVQANEMHRSYLKWRTGALRFRSRVDVKLSQVGYLKYQPRAVQVAVLSQAIQEHRRVKGKAADDSDRRLWGALQVLDDQER